jgi:hypothetical protein
MRNRRKTYERASRWGAERNERREHGLLRAMARGDRDVFELTCERCHRTFPTRRSHARTCSPGCRKALQRAKANPVRKCELAECPVRLNPPSSRKDRRFCTRAHAMKALRRADPRDLAEARQAKARKAITTVRKRKRGGRLRRPVYI